MAKGGTGVLRVDGKDVANKSIAHTIPGVLTIDETFDIGSDTRTPVDDSYAVPFRFTGTINKLTFHLGPGTEPLSEMLRSKTLPKRGFYTEGIGPDVGILRTVSRTRRFGPLDRLKVNSDCNLGTSE